jgi:allophanate hydrolase subunit 2
VYSERRHSDSGVTSVVLDVTAIAGTVTLVGGEAAGARRALVPELLAMANLVLRNPADAFALEVIGCATFTTHGSQLGVAIDDDGAVTMSPGNRLEVAAGARKRVRYLAVAGGILPIERHAGDTIKVSEHLRPGNLRGALVGGPGRIDLRGDEPILVRPGADAARFPAGAFEALCSGGFTVLPGGDRQGVRLAPAAGTASAALAGDGVAGEGTAPIPRGAIVLTPGGTLLVAGPDHPPQPGRPVLAVVDDRDLGRLAARAEGAPVRFAPL